MSVALQVISVIAVVGSVLVLAWQSREVARASRLATKTAVAAAITDSAANVRAVFEALLAYPELRAYITDGQPLPAAPRERAQAQTMCEMMCDAVEASLEVASRVPGADEALGGWPDWASWVLGASPGCADHVRQNGAWYPRLGELLPSASRPALPEV
jgi:hypothetical protein